MHPLAQSMLYRTGEKAKQHAPRETYFWPVLLNSIQFLQSEIEREKEQPVRHYFPGSGRSFLRGTSEF